MKKKERYLWLRIKAFFKDPNNKEITIRGVERDAEIKKDILLHALKGRTTFPEKYEAKTVEVLQRRGMPKRY